MWKSIDIGRVLKLLLVVAVSMFMLTACANDDKNPDTSRAAVKGTLMNRASRKIRQHAGRTLSLNCFMTTWAKWQWEPITRLLPAP